MIGVPSHCQEIPGIVRDDIVFRAADPFADRDDGLMESESTTLIHSLHSFTSHHILDIVCMSDNDDFAALKCRIEQMQTTCPLCRPVCYSPLFHKIRELVLQPLLGILASKYDGDDYSVRPLLLLACVGPVLHRDDYVNKLWIQYASLHCCGQRGSAQLRATNLAVVSFPSSRRC
jgi:hypothetical protein